MSCHSVVGEVPDSRETALRIEHHNDTVVLNRWFNSSVSRAETETKRAQDYRCQRQLLRRNMCRTKRREETGNSLMLILVRQDRCHICSSQNPARISSLHVVHKYRQ